MPSGEGTKALIEQLRDPIQSHRAVLALAMKGPDAVPALAEFLRSSKPSSLPEPRLMAVECLSILKGPEALEALIAVSRERLSDIHDPIIRLAEESVVSRAALALVDFPDDACARDTLLDLLRGKPLVGVAEAFEKLQDPRAISGLVSWLEEDFVAEAAWRAIVACGSAAVSPLLESLKEKHFHYGTETSASRRRRARILAILRELAGPADLTGLEELLEDPVEGVRWNAVHLLVERGSDAQKQLAFRVGMEFLDSADSFMRAQCEELLLAHFDRVRDLIEQEIDRRRRAGELERSFEPRETTLEVLLRVFRKGNEARGLGGTQTSSA